MDLANTVKLTELPFWSIWGGSLNVSEIREAVDVAQVACRGPQRFGVCWEAKLGRLPQAAWVTCVLFERVTTRILEKEGRKHLKRLAAALNSIHLPTIQSNPLVDGIMGTMKLLLDSVKGTDFWTKRMLSVRKPMPWLIQANVLPAREVKLFLNLRPWDQLTET